jgi:hypothetical protein
MRKTILTAALMLAFCCPALAGEIATPGTPAPPTHASVTQEPTTDGVMSTTSSGDLTQIALDLLAALPSLF